MKLTLIGLILATSCIFSYGQSNYDSLQSPPPKVSAYGQHIGNLRVKSSFWMPNSLTTQYKVADSNTLVFNGGRLYYWNGTSLVQAIGGGGGSVSLFSASALNPLFDVNVTNPSTTPSLSFSLKNVNNFEIYGRKNGGVGPPSFLTADSSIIFDLHSEAYYNTKYAPYGTVGGSTNTSVGSGYKVAINGTNNIKSLTAGWGTVLDSATSNEIKIKVDSTQIKTLNGFGNNFANTNLTATGDRDHDFEGHDLRINDAGEIGLAGNIVTASANGGSSHWHLRSDSMALNKRISYESDIHSSFTQHSLVDKDYTDSVSNITMGAVDGKPKSYSGATIDAKKLYLQKGTHEFEGVMSTDDKKRVDRQGIEISKYSFVTDGTDYYDNNSSTAVIKDTAYMVIKRAYFHPDPGWLPIYKSVDGCRTWDSVNVLGLGNNAFITAINDTIFFSYEYAFVSPYQYFGYILNGGQTVVLTDSIDVVGMGSVPYGKIIKLPSGKLIQSYYGYGTSWKIGLMESTDHIHWSEGTTIASGTNGPVELNETTVEWINPTATSDATCKLIAIARNEGVTGQHIQYNSSNGGSSWTRIGDVLQIGPGADSVYGYPAEILLFGGKLYLIAFIRSNIPGGSTAPDYHLAVCTGKPDEVFADSSKWSQPNRIYNSESNISGKGLSIDNGYPATFLINGNVLMAPYDISPVSSYVGDTRTRVFTMPLFQNSYCETYNTSNQSISASTETLVATPLTWLDTDYMFDSGTGLFTVKKDGWYNINAALCYQATLSGTYMEAYIKVLNPGYSTADRIIQSKTIQPTDNLQFCRMELDISYYLRAGEQVGFYTICDGTGNALRNQNEFKNRASIKISKYR